MNDIVTFLLVTYNQELYIKEALEAAVNQDYPYLEIVVSDDASTDLTYSIIKDFVSTYIGKHKILAYRNEKNLGLVGNLNRALSYSKGKYIVIAAGDDVSYPFRCSYSVDIIKKLNVPSVSFAYNKIDASGVVFEQFKNSSNICYVRGIQEYFDKPHYNTGCARIITRDLVEKFGYLNDSCPTEDTTFNLRSLMLGGLGFCEKPVIDYRIHGENISKGKNRYKKISPERIYEQYLADLNLAQEKKYISTSQYSSIKTYIDEYIERESAIQQLFDRGNCIRRLFFLIKVFLLQRYSYKTKFIVLKKYLSWLKLSF